MPPVFSDYQKIFKLLPEKCLILDVNLNIIAASDEQFYLNLLKEKTILNKNLVDIYQDIIDVQDLDKLSQSVLHAQKTNKQNEVEIKLFYLNESKKIDKILRVIHIPVCDEDGKIKYILHYVTDVTEFHLIKKIERQQSKITEELITHTCDMESEILLRMKELEERNKELQRINLELTKSEAIKSRLAVIVDSTEDAIITALPDGRIETWNVGAEKLYGYKADEMIGKTIDIVYTEDKMHEYLHVIEELKQGRAVRFLETERKHKNGNIISITVIVSPIKNNQMQVIGACSIAHDVSELKHIHSLKEKNKELEQISKLKNQFIANVSHELRTPLHFILGFSELLLQDNVNPLTDKQKEYINYICNGGKHLTLLINDILDLTKIEAGKMELHPVDTNVEELINEIKDVFHNALHEKNLKLNIDLDAKLKSIFIDSDKFKQIIYNYLSNAIKFTQNGGSISILTQLEDANMFRLTVKDTGIGINKDGLNKLFVAFQQLDDSTTKKYQGSGLGLAIVKRITKLLGGEVGVESALNSGSAFYVKLPCQQKENYLSR